MAPTDRRDTPPDDLSADYAAAGFGNRLGFGRRPALILVDPVKAYVTPGAPLYAGVEAAVAACAELAEAARAAGVPVIFTRVRYMADGADGGRFYQKVAALACFAGDDAPLGAFAEPLAPRADEVVVTKQYASAFFGTSLAATLTAMAVDTCLIGGLTTSGCVRATALDALQHGFIPVVIPEACGDRDARVQAANLFDLGQKYADVVAMAEVLAHLRDRP
ncbi:isochorismatase [Rhodothalassium salexigens]|uniref:isochorismatase family protein n=1 Tax=Rhodothalassium salexigens TaxID=1086 RepID=UPI001911F8A7|nr:isochorismatase family protein [Rhodothalassium salexigens]MBK5912381.1 isochorismatase [Rhodothalassium salexigens]